VFATKPLWFYVGDDVSVASYQSAIGEDAIKLEANTTQVYDLSTKQLLNQNIVYEFNLTQYKTTFDDWIIAFEKSIHKRTKNLREDVFIGLSSGYDSGAISCELNRQNVPYKAYCIVATEDHQTLNQRFNLFNSNTTGKYLRDAGKKYLDYINQNVEEFKYRIYSSSSDYNEFDKRLHDDRGSGGLSMIFHFAKKEGKKINLSGSGADEIFSDYGFGGVKKFAHSNFGGLYPENLSSIFPWASFYGSSMVSYLAKEEYIAGAYGIETRYPYLDKDVVQEFLWLHHTLKNSNYKSVLHEYFTKYNYPVKLDTKNGFGYIAPK
jgi:asparagine synthetase B (glutamine-hydrolysing)